MSGVPSRELATWAEETRRLIAALQESGLVRNGDGEGSVSHRISEAVLELTRAALLLHGIGAELGPGPGEPS